jgi:hypothetical protein
LKFSKKPVCVEWVGWVALDGQEREGVDLAKRDGRREGGGSRGEEVWSYFDLSAVGFGVEGGQTNGFSALEEEGVR